MVNARIRSKLFSDTLLCLIRNNRWLRSELFVTFQLFPQLHCRYWLRKSKLLHSNTSTVLTELVLVYYFLLSVSEHISTMLLSSHSWISSELVRMGEETSCYVLQFLDGCCIFSRVMMNSVFLSDVTIPENTKLQPETKFVKTWRMKNDGDGVWSATTKVSTANWVIFTKWQKFRMAGSVQVKAGVLIHCANFRFLRFGLKVMEMTVSALALRVVR